MNQEIQSAVPNEKSAAHYIGMSVSYLRKNRMDGKVDDGTSGLRWAKGWR